MPARAAACFDMNKQEPLPSNAIGGAHDIIGDDCVLASNVTRACPLANAGPGRSCRLAIASMQRCCSASPPLVRLISEE